MLSNDGTANAPGEIAPCVDAPSCRLLFVNRFFYPDSSATSQLLSDVAFHLARIGYDVHVVASSSRRERVPADARVHGVRIHRVPAPDLARLGLPGRLLEYCAFYLGASLAMRRLARRGDIIVAKTDPPMIGTLAGVAAWSRGARLVTWVQDFYPEVAARLDVPLLNGPVGRLLAMLRDATLRRAEINVVIGDDMAALALARGASSRSLRVIANWADDLEIKPAPPARAALRERHDLQDVFIVGYSGNLGRAHEYDTILEAADLLRGEKGLRFLQIGGGVCVAEMRKKLRARGLEGMFLFLPHQPRGELGDSLTAPDAHWLSLRPELEGLIVPSKFYGIAAAGRPVIAIVSEAGEIARILRREYCGVVIAPGAAVQLADAILRLKADPELCERMGANARRLIDDRYSKWMALEKWAELFASLTTSD